MRKQQKSKQSTIHSKFSDRQTERSQMTCTHFAYTHAADCSDVYYTRKTIPPLCWLCVLQAAVDSQNEWLGCALATATNGVSEELTQYTTCTHRRTNAAQLGFHDFRLGKALGGRQSWMLCDQVQMCIVLNAAGRSAAPHISCFAIEAFIVVDCMCTVRRHWFGAKRPSWAKITAKTFANAHRIHCGVRSLLSELLVRLSILRAETKAEFVCGGKLSNCQTLNNYFKPNFVRTTLLAVRIGGLCANTRFVFRWSVSNE